MTDGARTDTSKLIRIPAVITLAVTLLRLAGELQDWAPMLFSKAAGGGGALVGISWLVLPFGAWFGWKLGRSGPVPASFARAFGVTLLSLILLPVLGVATFAAGMDPQGVGTFAVFVVGALVGLWIGLGAWPALGRTLLSYAFAARIPVVLVMLAAILGDWGTHYDVAPPGLPAMGAIMKWIFIGVVPQMTFWIWFTVVVGSLSGVIAGAMAARRRAG